MVKSKNLEILISKNSNKHVLLFLYNWEAVVEPDFSVVLLL